MEKRIFRPLHYAISVSDMDSAIQWFETNLNFRLRMKSEMTPMGFKAAFMDNGEGFELEIFEPEEPKPLPPDRTVPNTDNMTVGNKHLAFKVDDLDEVYNEFVKNGVDIVMPPFEAFGLHCIFIHGPEDILIEFIERK